MTVPVTVNSVREQIRGALKLSLATKGTALDTVVSYGNITDKSKYPLFKAYFTDSNLVSQLFGRVDIVEDILTLEVAPYCTENDFELETSKVIESYRAFFNIDLVRDQMHANYKDSLQQIKVTSAKLLNTNLSNPYCAVLFTLNIKYSLQS